MRKIRFRVWDIENKCWYRSTQLVIRPYSGTATDGATTPNVVLNQWTGLKDKNNVLIYEGDIIEFVWEEDSCWGDEGTYRGYVQHDDGGYEVVYINRQEYTLTKDGGKHPNNESDELQSFIRWTEGVNCEVIGNIYENPELLKED